MMKCRFVFRSGAVYVFQGVTDDVAAKMRAVRGDLPKAWIYLGASDGNGATWINLREVALFALEE